MTRSVNIMVLKANHVTLNVKNLSWSTSWRAKYMLTISKWLYRTGSRVAIPHFGGIRVWNKDIFKSANSHHSSRLML